MSTKTVQDETPKRPDVETSKLRLTTDPDDFNTIDQAAFER